MQPASCLLTDPSASMTDGAFVIFSLCMLVRSRTADQGPGTRDRGPGPAPPPSMDRSARELFLNFMIVLITVLLMWLLVKTYQD